MNGQRVTCTHPRSDTASLIRLVEDASEHDDVRHPLDETAVLIQRYNSVGANVCASEGKSAFGIKRKDERNVRTESTISGISVLPQQLDDHRVELHQSSVLAQIILGLAKEAVELTIAAPSRDLARTLQRGHDHDGVVEAYRVADQQCRKIREDSHSRVKLGRRLGKGL